MPGATAVIRQPIVVSPTSTTAYSVTITNGSGCISTASATVTVLPAAPATLTITSFTCITTNSVLTGVDFVIGYSDGSFAPAVPNLFLNGLTITGQLGQLFTLNFDANQEHPAHRRQRHPPGVLQLELPTGLCQCARQSTGDPAGG